MQINMLKSKIHRATVVQSELDYVGSITVDEDLMDASGIYEYEKVQIADVNNGNRFETYVIAGERGSGMICLNGAAAHMVSLGDKIIIMICIVAVRYMIRQIWSYVSIGSMFRIRSTLTVILKQLYSRSELLIEMIISIMRSCCIKIRWQIIR